jgi:hypothetical protein
VNQGDGPGERLVKVVFSLDFDGGAWPGPLAGREAAAGETWVGPAGLLDLLETRLGIGEALDPPCVRAAGLVAAILRIDGFWSRSAAVDALGTARRLLDWRDALRLHGWRGEAASPRLGALAHVTADARPGWPDRLEAIARALARRGAGLQRLEVMDPIPTLPSLWRHVLATLSGRGTLVAERSLSPARALGDLAAARTAPFAPAGDGSLQLLRPDGPLAAAEEVAAWLAAVDHGGTVVIGGAPVLDAALRRHGLPTIGAAGHPSDDAVLQVLPLALAMASSPVDPARALEFLALPLSPIPRSIAGRLASTLRQWPAVGSDAWNQALAAGLASLPEAERSEVSERLDVLFRHGERNRQIARSALLSLLDVLDDWLRPRRPDRDGAAGWAGARSQCALVRRLVSFAPREDLSLSDLARIVEAATEEVSGRAPFGAEAGIAGVRWPGAVAGPASRVIWWSFVRDATETMPPVPLTQAERIELERVGVRVPTRAELAQALAPRRRRPLEQTRDVLVLVAPRHGDDGDEVAPHPVWDEIIARLGRAEDASSLETARVRATPPLALVEAPARTLPAPRRTWRVKGDAIARPERESVASVADLLGCPFRWLVERVARVRDGIARPLPTGPLLFGLVAHEVLARTLKATPAGGDDAERLATEVFDRDGPRLGAALFQPGMEEACAEVRVRTARAARAIATAIPAGRRLADNVERTVSRELLGGRFEGRMDLVLVDPPAIVDFKWGRLRDRRRALGSGTAHQLAAYVTLLGDGGGAAPAAAYFILESQRLIALDGMAFPGADVVRGPSLAETWRATERAVERRRAELAGGALSAPGNAGAVGETGPTQDALVGGTLVLAPTCDYCRLGALCGRAFGGAR